MQATMNRDLFDGMGIENLESRTMMAGDVTAALAGGDLVLNGDNEGNQVVVRATDQSGRFVVEGINGTTINGQQSVVVDGVDDDFRINLRNGDNALLLTGEGADGTERDLNVPDDVRIRTGSGRDIVVFDNVRVQDSTNVNSGSGDDVVIGFESRFVDGVRVNAGSGNDTVGFQDCDLSGRVRIVGNSGNDDVLFFETLARDRVDVATGSGDDYLGISDAEFNDDLRFNGGGDDDQLLEYALAVQGETQLRSVETAEQVGANAVSDAINDQAGVLAAVNLIFQEGTGF